MVFLHFVRYSRMFPNFNDAVTLRVEYGKRRALFKARSGRPEEFILGSKDIAKKFKEQGQGEYQNTSQAQ